MSVTTTEMVLNSDRRKKQRLVNSLGGKCYVCGYDRCLSALEFHHTNPKQKKFTISTKAHRSFEKDLQEAKKCVLVCSNCHREIHAGLIENLPDSSYDEELAQKEIEKLNAVKNKKIQYCKDCGKEISYGAKRCPKCAAKSREKVERPSREELKNLIRTMPFTQIAKKYDVTDNAIRKWCISFNLPNTKKQINNYTNKEWEKI